MFGKHLSEEQRKKYLIDSKVKIAHFMENILVKKLKGNYLNLTKAKYDGEKNPMFGKNAWEIFEQKHGHEALEKKREYSKKVQR